MASGNVSLASGPAEARNCWGSQGPLRAWGTHPLREPYKPAEQRGWRGREGCWAEPPGLACPVSGRTPLRGCRQAGRKLQPLPQLKTKLSPSSDPGGNSDQSGKLKGLPLRGRRMEEGKLGEGWKGAQVAFHAMGPTPSAQRGRTATTQVVYVHIQFITFIENRKPHT